MEIEEYRDENRDEDRAIKICFVGMIKERHIERGQVRDVEIVTTFSVTSKITAHLTIS